MAAAPLLAELQYLKSIVALCSVNFNIARMTGPALAGLLISLSGIGVALAIQTVFFLPNFLVLSLLKLRCREGKTKAQPSLLAEIFEGLALARYNTIIRQALLLSAVYGFLARGVMDILPVIAGAGFERGADGFGLLASSAGAGALMGGFHSVVSGQRQAEGISRPTVVGCFLGMGAVATIGISPIWEITVFSVLILGCCTSITAISIVTSINLITDDRMRGRIGSIWLTTAIGSAAVGALILGLAIEWLGLSVALSLAGILGAILTALILTFLGPSKFTNY